VQKKIFYAVIPAPEDLLRLEPEELAGVILEHLHSCKEDEGIWSIHNYCNILRSSDCPQVYRDREREVGRALMESLMWLQHEGLIAPKPDSSSGSWFYMTRRGKRLKGKADLSVYKKAKLLPENLLHPVIAEKVSSAFLRGEYDTAVFQAFRQVEIALRAAGQYQATDIGTDLARKAFHVSNGPLTDTSLPEAERSALQHLFAGAIGSYKNPLSHRSVTISDPIEAIEMVFLASHLLNIVDARVKARQAPTS